MQAVKTDNAPKAIGPYSQAIITNNLIFVSGQLPIDPLTNEFAGNDIKSQTKQSLLNIQAILKENNCDLNNVVKTTVYLKNMADFNDMNEIYAQYFKEPYPARVAIEVAALPKNALIEIEAIVEK